MSHGKTLAFSLAAMEDSEERRDGLNWGFSRVSWATRWGMDCQCVGLGDHTEAAAKFRPETLAPGPGY